MENIKNILKELANRRLEISLLHAKIDDLEYQELMNQIIVLENQYDSFTLDPDIKNCIDQLLATRDKVNMECVLLAYLDGMKDCLTILKELQLLQL